MGIALLDAGAQYVKVIDRRVRELSVKSDILPLDTAPEQLKKYSGIIISGGPGSVNDPDAPKPHPDLFSLDKPILGICYGLQLINQHYGGTVTRKSVREDGQEKVTTTQDKLFMGLMKEEDVLLTHGDSIDEVPEGFNVTAESEEGIIAAISNEERQRWGVQFHPEVDLTKHGKQILENFLYGICAEDGTFTVADRKEESINELRKAIGEQHILTLVSGGVDSTVLASLLAQAVPADQVTAIHIDNGFMRQDESRLVKKALSIQGITLKVINAEERFYEATTTISGKKTKRLSETVQPETKRKIIGDTFMRVAEDETKKLGLDPDKTLLAQGTLRPDLIESASKMASGKADTIKTHHNDTQLVRELRERGRVIEPLKDFHKDEVRELGRQLGLPEALVQRQPFPGPGLAIRILCAEKPYRTEEFEHINKELQKTVTAPFSATLLPIRTVGVQGDGRSYNYAAALTGPEDWEKLFGYAKELPRRFHTINRVVYVFGEKVEGPIEDITVTHLTQEVIEQLREADHQANKVMEDYGLQQTLSQVPIISFPIAFSEGKRSICIRTFITNDFMTGVPATPGKEMPLHALKTMVEKIGAVKDVSRVAYDLTAKPPGTTEWE